MRIIDADKVFETMPTVEGCSTSYSEEYRKGWTSGVLMCRLAVDGTPSVKLPHRRDLLEQLRSWVNAHSAETYEDYLIWQAYRLLESEREAFKSDTN